MQVPVEFVKAFTRDKSQGNPAGVVLDANNLSTDQMQNIATSLGFSESAFIQDSNTADFKLRFFSVSQEVDFCGHATIAAFHAIANSGRIRFDRSNKIQLTQQTGAGILNVACFSDGKVEMSQAAPVFDLIEENVVLVASLLSLTKEDILNYPIQSVSTGVSKLIVPVKSLQSVLSIKPKLQAIKSYLIEKNIKGIYAFTSDAMHADADFYARQFNPAAGIDEDPITGIAAGALGAYVQKYRLANKPQFVVEQGYGMYMGGEMYVDTNDSIRVGGYAVSFGEHTVGV